MMDLDFNAIVNIVCVVGSVIFFIAKLDAMTKANREFYENTINQLHENMSDKFTYLERNMTEKFNSVNERFSTIKSDITRLEHKQEESNRIKERLAILEHAFEVSQRVAGAIHLENHNIE